MELKEERRENRGDRRQETGGAGEGATQESVLSTWVFILVLAISFLLFSLFIYRVVGDMGQPTWDYGTIKDVPAGSPYAIYDKLPYPQHVKGEKGE